MKVLGHVMRGWTLSCWLVVLYSCQGCQGVIRRLCVRLLAVYRLLIPAWVSVQVG